MGDIEVKLGHSNIADVVLKRIRKYCRKKTKGITKEEKQKYKTIFEGKKGVFIIEKLARDVIENCKLPEAADFRKKLVCNRGNIMVREETSIAEKIIKLFPDENIVLNKKFNNRKLDVWFKDRDTIVEIDEGNHESYDTDDEEERKKMFKKHNFKIFPCNPTDPSFNTPTFFGEINSYIKNLCEKEAVNSGDL